MNLWIIGSYDPDTIATAILGVHGLAADTGGNKVMTKT